MTTTVPSWVSIDPSSGVLTLTAPEVASDSTFNFYINTAVSGVVNPVQKLIKLTILNCSPSNCQKCQSTSSSTWITCNSGYELISGGWKSLGKNSQTASETAQSLSTTTTSAIMVTIGITALTSLINTSSLASLWMTINQMQLFFMLLLTRAYIPYDIQVVIEGSDYTSNAYEYLPFKRIGIFPSFLHNFEFELTDKTLESFGIKYDSTVANLFTTFSFTFLMLLFSVFIYLLRLILSKLRENTGWSCFTKTLYWISDKLYRILIFGYFIRNSLEMSQFILVSSFHEIYELNTTDSYRISSFIFSIWMIIIFWLMLSFIQYLIFSSYRYNENEHNKWEEFFRGLKQNKKSKFYLTMLLLRRLVFVSLLITWVNISSRAFIVILALIQAIYIIYLSCIRPWEAIKGNIIEIMNEFYFLFLLIFLSIINTENDWNSAKTSLYLWVLISNTLIIFLIVLSKKLTSYLIVFSTIEIYKWMWNWCKKNKVWINISQII